jgi:hypothetical protein
VIKRSAFAPSMRRSKLVASSECIAACRNARELLTADAVLSECLQNPRYRVAEDNPMTSQG